MSALSDFAARVDGELRAADGASIAPEQEAAYMAELTSKRQEFERQAERLLVEIVRPRMQIVARKFPNANPARKCEHGHCTWWFGYTERFPASVKIELCVDHDKACENLLLTYELSILPSFAKYERFDRLSLPIAGLDDAAIEVWLEQRLIKFVTTYISLENSDRDQTAALVTDPVCGMRIDRQRAAASAKRSGYDYFFCSTACCAECEADPARYAKMSLI